MVEKKAAIVTGAGSGIGRQTGLLLAREGYQLILAGRTLSKLTQTIELIHAQHGRQADCRTMAVNLCDPEQARSLVDASIQHFGRVDAVANVAGYAPLLSIEQTTPQAWQQCVDTNLSCVVHLVAAVWPVFRHQNGGVVVNVSSMASIDPFPGLWIYAVAKAGLNMFTQCIAKEGDQDNIKAVAIAPGAVETPMLRSLFDSSSLPPDRTLDPADIAQVISECITGKRWYENGQTIAVPSP